MSFHSQNSSIGYWNISNGCNITIAVLNVIYHFTKRISYLYICSSFARLYLSIATLSFPNKENRYLGPCSDLNWCFNKRVKYIDSLTITHLSHFLLQSVQNKMMHYLGMLDWSR